MQQQWLVATETTGAVPAENASQTILMLLLLLQLLLLPLNITKQLKV